MLEIDLGTLQYSYGKIKEKSSISGSYGSEGDILSISPMSDDTYGIKCVIDHNNYEVYLTLEVHFLDLLWILGAGVNDDYKALDLVSITVDDAISTPPTSRVSKKQLIKDLQEDYKYDAQFFAAFRV